MPKAAHDPIADIAGLSLTRSTTRNAYAALQALLPIRAGIGPKRGSHAPRLRADIGDEDVAVHRQCVLLRSRKELASRYVSRRRQHDEGDPMVMAVLANLEFDERAELVHFIHVGSVNDEEP